MRIVVLRPLSKLSNENESVCDGFEVMILQVRTSAEGGANRLFCFGKHILSIGEQITFQCAFKSVDRGAVSNVIWPRDYNCTLTLRLTLT